MEKPLCSVCRHLKGDQWDEAQCAVCLPPLLEENEDAARIYVLVRNQYIFGPRGPVDINHLAVHEAMKLYEVEDRIECFEKVLNLASYFIDKIRKEGE